MRQRSGFTLPEILMGLVILAILMLAAFQFVGGSVRTYRKASDMLERVQLESTARNVVIR